MKISLVTISFNQGRFLEHAIRSVLEQDHAVEYIVVDAGSTDGSREIIDRYANSIARIIYGADRGPADGLNKGFAEASGDIFGFLNSDDILERGTLRQVADYFDAHPDIDVVSGHSWIIDANGRLKRRFFSDRYSLKMAVHGACVLSQASTFFRADFFRRVGGFNTENRSNWDGELFVDLALAGARFSRVSSYWSRFRVHEQGITGSGKLRSLSRLHTRNMFLKVMGREPTSIDRIIGIGAQYLRKFLNPADTIERLLRGPIA